MMATGDAQIRFLVVAMAAVLALAWVPECALAWLTESATGISFSRAPHQSPAVTADPGLPDSEGPISTLKPRTARRLGLSPRPRASAAC